MLYKQEMVNASQQGYWRHIIDSYNDYKNIKKIAAELNLEHQIACEANNLACFNPQEIFNRPKYWQEPNYDLFPSDLSALADRVGSATGWDKLSIVVPILSAIAASTWGRVKINVTPSWSEPLALYVLPTAPSGAMKTFLIDLLKKPFVDFISPLSAEYDGCAPEQKYVKTHTDRAIDDICNKRVKKIIKEDLKEKSSGYDEKLILKIKEETKEAHAAKTKASENFYSACPNLFVSCGTEKGLAEDIAEQGECQASMDSEGGFISKIVNDSRYSVELLLKAYDGTAFIYRTSNVTSRLHYPILNLI